MACVVRKVHSDFLLTSGNAMSKCRECLEVMILADRLKIKKYTYIDIYYCKMH